MDPHNLYKMNALVPRNAPSEPRMLATIDLRNRDAVRQYVELAATYERLRGTRPAAHNKLAAKTTVGDVKAIASRWSAELKKVKPRTAHDRSEHRRWRACLDDVERTSAGLALSAVYPPIENEAFWKCARRLAIYLESRKVVPSRWKLAVSALTETLAEVPSAVGGATKSAASVAAGIVREPAKLAAVLLGAALLAPPLIRAFRGKR